MPVIPDTLEAEAGGFQVRGQPRLRSCLKKKKRVGVEGLEIELSGKTFASMDKTLVQFLVPPINE
jgi:hypothetical protein